MRLIEAEMRAIRLGGARRWRHAERHRHLPRPSPGVAADDPRWREQLDRLSDHVLGWTGNHAGISEVAATDVRRLRRERPPIVQELINDAITISGSEPGELLRARR
jgi:hypothetical protein